MHKIKRRDNIPTPSTTLLLIFFTLILILVFILLLFNPILSLFSVRISFISRGAVPASMLASD